MRTVLAIDMGSSTIRGYLGTWRDGHLKLQEVHRAPHEVQVKEDGSLCWEVANFIAEAVRAGQAAATELGQAPDSVGVDGWGVDFACVDDAGEVLGEVYAYRDQRGEKGRRILAEQIAEDRLFELSGVAVQDINTLNRLAYATHHGEELPGQLMFIQDIVARALASKPIPGWDEGADPGIWASRAVASTSGLVSATTGDWDDEILAAVGIEREFLPPIAEELTVIGQRGNTSIIRAGSHDTACAVYSLNAAEGDVFISCGSWAIVGACADVLLDPAVTNEARTDGGNRVQFNLTGMWIAQECRRYWASHGEDVSYDRLAALIAEEPSPGFVIDTNDPSLAEPGDMPNRIAKLAAAQGHSISGIGATLRLVDESLAYHMAQAVQEIRQRCHTQGHVHVMGGGTNNRFLMQQLANQLNEPINIAADEASVLGNVLAQLHVLGVKPEDTARWLAEAGITETIRPESTQN